MTYYLLLLVSTSFLLAMEPEPTEKKLFNDAVSHYSFPAEPAATLTLTCFGGDKRSIPLDIAHEIIDAQRLEQAQPHVTGSILDIPHTIETLDTFLAYQMTPSPNRARWFAKLSDQRQADLFDITHWLDTKTFDQLVQKNNRAVLNARPSEHPYVRFICKDSSVDVTQGHFEALLGQCREGHALHSFKALSNDFASNESRAISLDCTSKTIAMIVADTLSNKKLFERFKSLKISEKIELIKTVDYLGHVQDEAIANHFVTQELLPTAVLDRALSCNYPACLNIGGIEIIRRAFLKLSMAPLAEIFRPKTRTIDTIDVDENERIVPNYTGSKVILTKGTTLRIWDTNQHKIEAQYQRPNNIICSLFSPDDTLCISGCRNGSIVVIDNATGKKRSITLPQINHLALSACSDDASQLCVFDEALLSPAKKHLLLRIDIKSILDHEEPNPLDPHDQDDNDAYLSDWLPQSVINTVTTPNRIHSIIYRPETHEVAAGGYNGIVIWRDHEQSQPTISIGKGYITDMKFTPDGTRLLWIEHDTKSSTSQAWTVDTSSYQSPELIYTWEKKCIHIYCRRYGKCYGPDLISQDARFISISNVHGRRTLCLEDQLVSQSSSFYLGRNYLLNPRYPYASAHNNLVDNRSEYTMVTNSSMGWDDDVFFSGDGNRLFHVGHYPPRKCGVIDLTKLNKLLSSSFNDWSLAQLMALCGLYYRGMNPDYVRAKNYLTPVEVKSIERLFDMRFKEDAGEFHPGYLLNDIKQKKVTKILGSV